MRTSQQWTQLVLVSCLPLVTGCIYEPQLTNDELGRVIYTIPVNPGAVKFQAPGTGASDGGIPVGDAPESSPTTGTPAGEGTRPTADDAETPKAAPPDEKQGTTLESASPMPPEKGPAPPTREDAPAKGEAKTSNEAKAPDESPTKEPAKPAVP